MIDCYFGRIGNGLSGGVCDMVALACFLKERRPKSFNMMADKSSIRILSNYNLFRRDMASKDTPWRLEWIDGGQFLTTGREVSPLVGVHFQGGAKRLIRHFAIKRNPLPLDA